MKLSETFFEKKPFNLTTFCDLHLFPSRLLGYLRCIACSFARSFIRSVLTLTSARVLLVLSGISFNGTPKYMDQSNLPRSFEKINCRRNKINDRRGTIRYERKSNSRDRPKLCLNRELGTGYFQAAVQTPPQIASQNKSINITDSYSYPVCPLCISTSCVALFPHTHFLQLTI